MIAIFALLLRIIVAILYEIMLYKSAETENAAA
jgi:hypothetical protein